MATMDGPGIRIALVVVLLGVLAGQFVWFGSDPPPAPARNLFGTNLDENYDSYVDERGVVDGTVVSTAPVVIAIDRDDTDVRLTISGLDRQVSTGDRLRVYGVLRPDHEMDAIDTVVVPAWGLPYTYAVSAVSGLWVLSRTVRDWRFDVARLTLERREPTSAPEEGR